MLKVRKGFVALEVVLVVLPVLSACSSNSTGSGNGTMVIAMPDDYDTLDPVLTQGFDMGNTLRALTYDRLVEVNEKGGVVPHLATSWTESTDGRSYTFDLRTDAVCADGTKLSASDVADSLRRLAQGTGPKPSIESPFAYRTFGQAGVSSITADDGTHTVTINLNEPYSDLLTGLAMTWASIVCPAGLEDPKELTNHTFGTGVYVISRASRGNQYTLTRRDNYSWGPQGASLSSSAPAKIVVRQITSESTRANLLLSGEVDAAFLSGADLDRVAANESLYRYDVIDNGGYGLQFNEQAGLPGADETFREAIMMAIDPAQFAKAATFGNGKWYSTLYSPNLPGYNAANGEAAPRYDPDAAKSLLREAGWAPGPGGKLAWKGEPYSLRVVGYTDQQSGPDYILDVLQKLGFDATLRKPDVSGWIDIVYTTGEYDIDAYGYSSRFPSPGLFAGQLRQAHIDNKAYFRYATLAERASAEQRCKYWQKAEVALLSRHDSMNLAIPVFSWFGNGYKFRAPNQLLWPTSIQAP